MKKIIVLGILIFIAANVQIVQAGELNQYEAEIVSKARGQFEKDGVKYQVDPVLVQELINYLSLDETDLTAAQKNEVIAQMYANIEQGIEEGYLIPVTVQDKEEVAKENHVEAADGDSAVSEENEKDKTAEEDNKVKTEKKGVAGNDFFKKIKKPVTNLETDKNNGRVTVTDEEGGILLTVDTVVKNTGFNINGTIVMLTGMGIVFGICSITAYRCGFLNHRKEHWD